MLTFEVRQDRGAHTVILSQDFALSLALLRRGTLEQKLEKMCCLSCLANFLTLPTSDPVISIPGRPQAQSAACC